MLSEVLGAFTELPEVADEVFGVASASGSLERLSRKLLEVVEASSPTCVKYWSTVAVVICASACRSPVAAMTTATTTANVSASDALPNRILPLANCALPVALLLRCSLSLRT